MNKNYSFVLLIVAAVLTTLSSCKKTIGLEPLIQNKMLEYKVSNLADTEIYGAIDNYENTITLYVPFFSNLSVIDPKIQVDAGAKLKDEILPVDVNSTSQTYTVIAADGEQRIYKLVIVPQNTPSLELEYQDPTSLVSYPLAQLPAVKGNFLSTNRQAADVTLINRASKKEFELDKTSGDIYLFGTDYVLQQINLPANIDTGYFDVQVRFLGHKVTLSQPVHIIHRQPRFSNSSITFKPGDNITYQAYNSVVLGLKSVTVTLAGKTYDWPIVSSDLQSATVKVPDDFPVGVYTDYELRPTISFSFEGWANQVVLQAMTVNSK